MRGRRGAAATAAASPIARADLERADRTLLDAVGGALETAARRAGAWLACRSGCSECCIGPFPITRLDVMRLRRGLEELAARDPSRAGAIEARARAAIESMRADFPGDAASGRLGGNGEAEDRFFARRADAPCPVLDPETGACDLYESRPMTCRIYGPPVRTAGQSLPPCRLCFDGAPDDAVERCRVEPDPDGIERAIVGRLERAGDGEWETVIAFAVDPDRPRED